MQRAKVAIESGKKMEAAALKPQMNRREELFRIEKIYHVLSTMYNESAS